MGGGGSVEVLYSESMVVKGLGIESGEQSSRLGDAVHRLQKETGLK
jgi:hypothetical protein